MDANVMIGLAILALAMVTAGIFTAIVLAAGHANERPIRSPYGLRTGAVSVRPGRGSSTSSPTRCYYDCMTGFRWTNDWNRLCREACGAGTNLPTA
jgi:hypothetical protein